MIMRNNVRHFHKPHSGFTLVEIMVALAISALLLGGITQVFLTLKQTNRASTALSHIRESGQIAYDVMAYDARLAGYLGCSDPSLQGNVNVVSILTRFMATNLRHQAYGEQTSPPPDGAPPAG